MAKSILTLEQRRCLDWLAEQPLITQRFYLSGGTALAEFYLQHRYSEDLDFFSPIEFDFTTLQPQLRGLQKFFGGVKVTIEQQFNRNLVLLHLPGGPLKLEFTWFIGEPIEAGTKHHQLTIDSQLDLAVNKLFTIYQRPRARDYVDLYYLFKRYPLTEVMRLARNKFDWHIDPLQLGARFNSPDLGDWPRMIKPLTPTTVKRYFEKLALTLGPDIIV